MNLFLISPALLMIFIVFVIPMVRYAWLSLHSISVVSGLEAVPNNFANWERLFSDSRFWIDVIQTSRFALISVSLELILGIAIALILNQGFKGRSIVRALTLLPWALPTAIMALGWRWIFNSPYGPIDQILNKLILYSPNILSSPNMAWIATVIGDVWKTTPFIAIIILAGLQNIPSDLYEAFKIEGGKEVESFLKITLPLLKPYILLSVIFRLAQAFGVFDLIQILTGGGPAGSTESLALYAYINAMRFLDFGYSSTIMMASFILLLIFSLLFYLTLNYYQNIRKYLLK